LDADAQARRGVFRRDVAVMRANSARRNRQTQTYAARLTIS
jgi:hypothetical protein